MELFSEKKKVSKPGASLEDGINYKEISVQSNFVSTKRKT